jgi:hypothetical protein
LHLETAICAHCEEPIRDAEVELQALDTESLQLARFHLSGCGGAAVRLIRKKERYMFFVVHPVVVVEKEPIGVS